jgi:NADPH:quinone reductase-like Zn-dependent oxidoreductase
MTMKAAVLHHLGTSPVYENAMDPVPQNDEQHLLHVKAAAVKNIDKLRAGGSHYASYTQLPVVVGIDGVGILDDGRRVYSHGITGMIAEKALVSKHGVIEIPDQLDFDLAAALPNAVMGAAMALRFRAKMERGNVVFINGATGVTGQMAVQMAKHYGASKIIVSGRDQDMLEKCRALGADILISLAQDDTEIIAQIKNTHLQNPINIVIDYLWGHPVELFLKSLKGGGVNNFTHQVRIVTVGDMAGEAINLSSGILRSSNIEILGSGLGSLSREDFGIFNTHILPEIFQLAVEGKIVMDLKTESLENIEKVWSEEVEKGKRLVIRI